MFILSGNRSLNKRQIQVDSMGPGFWLDFADLAQMRRWGKALNFLHNSFNTHNAMAIFRSCANALRKSIFLLAFLK